MAIGRNFLEAISKALRSLEQGAPEEGALKLAAERLETATDLRLQGILEALRGGMKPTVVASRTGYPPGSATGSQSW